MMKRKLQPPIRSSSDSGFTIIESLMGIVVVAILLASIAPVLVMSTAIRVQSRRIEKATQAANTFVDGVKTGSILAPGEYSEDNKIPLPAATITEPRTLDQNLINLTKMPVPATQNDDDLYLFKKDGVICHTSESDCEKDATNPFEEFYIQARQMTVTGTQNDGYRLGIRVYRGDVDFSKTLLASEDDQKTVESPITGTLGNKQAPAVERTVDIGNRNTTFQALCSRLGMGQITNEDGTKEEQACQ
ncbi:hormogonium polysaccharide secretion pseudopilin HpsB [Anabaena sp. UHCC 0204]|uniref:hormogonium polysaccharide secretion pseudopilin HpsB n=1 Tax=Anabaena sp. UHCC 0204 TaxID=2590009 RepID=UPI001446E049|nr:hormogonium polysaccharide secretion pseudopilin HpsB [Anabaena sp. UHCC 0204]MTJ06618.1 type II secretion system protein [Anabaena sp. UHCC 0204]